MIRILKTAVCCLALTACDLVAMVEDDKPNVDGSYLGDMSAKVTYYVEVNGGVQARESNISGAVGFTLKGTRVITNPTFAEEGVAEWDHVNRYWWIDFKSIRSASAQFCHQWKYSGILRESDGYIRADGTVSCMERSDLVQPITGNWYARRQ